MVIICAITPLVGAIFGTTRILRTTVTIAKTTASLAHVQDQEYLLYNGGFMMNAYASQWFDQSLPGFTTAEYAILPFTMETGISPDLDNETWTANTLMYTTTLDCQPAIINWTVSPAFGDPSGRSYSNGKGCTTSSTDSPYVSPDSKTPFTGLYIGYYPDIYTDYSLSSMGCPDTNNSHLFLATWATNLPSRNPNPNLTALFCEPAYWSQPVNATVDVSNKSVLSVAPLSPRQSLAQQFFNTTNFEYVIGTGTGDSRLRSDIFQAPEFINQEPQLLKIGFNSTATNLVGFALGGSRLGLDQYMNATILASSFEKAHKLLFALAVTSMLSTNISSPNPRTGIIRGNTNAVVIVRIFAVIVEVSLGLVVSLAVALLYTSRSRASGLRTDPASLTEIIDMICQCAPSIEQIQDAAVASNDGPRISVTDGKFRFHATSWDLRRTKAEPLNLNPESDRNINTRSCIRIPYTENLVRPLVMSLKIGFVLVTVLLMVTTVVICFQIQIQNHHGLPLPSSNHAVNQIFLNYVPIVFATLLEAFWNLLNRLISILQPFKSLRTRRAKATVSLDVKYSSLPPPLLVFRALQAHHPLLAAVCAVALSANLLAVAFGGLFTTSLVDLESRASFSSQFLPVTNIQDVILNRDSNELEYLYAAHSNFSKGAPLPPWVTRDRFFLPFSLNASTASGDVQLHKATTQGFGVSVECNQVNLDTRAFVTSDDGKWSLVQQSPTGHDVDCGGIIEANLFPSKSIAALEVLQKVSPRSSNATNEDYAVCNSTIVAGLIRGNLTVVLANLISSISTDELDSYNTRVSNINSLSSLWLACRPTILVAPYEILVRPEGHVQSYTRKAPYSTDLSMFFAGEHGPTRLLSLVGELVDKKPIWHNDTLAETYVGSFIKALTNSSNPIDPSLPLPAFELIKPVIEDIYTRLYAIILGTHLEWFMSATPESTIPGTVFVPSTRVFMSRTMFIVVITLLSLNVVVAIACYSKRPRPMLQQMPDTIANVLALFEGSGIVAERDADKGWPADWKFGYGKFDGLDGKPHLGIDRQPFVVPLNE